MPQHPLVKAEKTSYGSTKVTGERKKDSEPKPESKGKIESLRIEVATNGFIVHANRVPEKTGSNSVVFYREEKPHICPTADDLATYISSLVGGSATKDESKV